MLRIPWIVALLLGAASGAGPPPGAPRLLLRLPEICPTPDGMTVGADGNVIVACPNFADPSHPGVLLTVDAQNRPRLLARVPTHPLTGVACPMGIDRGPEGELYVADNQGWAAPRDEGRVLRLVLRDGRVERAEVVARGLRHPNGVRVRGEYVYVTQSLLVKDGDAPLVSGVYRFRLTDRDVAVQNGPGDPQLLATFRTLNAAVQYGADGLVFDRAGRLYVGNFGDATVHRLVFDDAGRVVSNTVFARDAALKSVDGLAADADDNLYVADFSGNALAKVGPDGRVTVLARSPDGDGADGGLDQPGEPLVRGRQVILSNFDLVTGPDKVNTRHDEPQTLSVVDLE